MTQRGGRRAFLYFLAVIVGFLALSALLHLPDEAEHWSADFVTSKFSSRLPFQHKSIVLVYVSDATLETYACVSPIDRQLLADLVTTVDQAGAKVIGLDTILDRYTEKQKDTALRAAVRHTKARMVLGEVVEPSAGPHAQTEWFFAKADGNDPAVGHLYFDEHHRSLVVSDHVVRFIAEQPVGPNDRPSQALPEISFAEALAHAAGTDFKPSSHYIDWLLPPENGAETFMALTAEDVLGRGNAKLPLSDMLRDKIVLIGGNFEDRDQHLTPLSVSRDDFYSGLFIHAQILAQLLAGRSIIEWSLPVQLLIASAAAVVGYWLGRRSGHYYLWLELASVAGLALIGFLAFWSAKVMFPFNLVLIFWLAGAAAGHYAGADRHTVRS